MSLKTAIQNLCSFAGTYEHHSVLVRTGYEAIQIGGRINSLPALVRPDPAAVSTV